MVERVALGGHDQLHYFVPAGVWDAAPVEEELLIQADRLVGSRDAVLKIDDTALRRRGSIRSGSRRSTPRRWARTPIARHWCH
jgi:hypothetical protein